MKPIANSQLTGKWYSIARTCNFFEIKFVEIFLYVSIAYENYLDLLYVGITKEPIMAPRLMKNSTTTAIS